ncbi:Unknown protein sequence [Pseudomonas amygdali pv. lachrymans]|nr:Unknown protein sequence [Pseudomonas amygdali pv. lachrymans]
MICEVLTPCLSHPKKITWLAKRAEFIGVTHNPSWGLVDQPLSCSAFDDPSGEIAHTVLEGTNICSSEFDGAFSALCR